MARGAQDFNPLVSIIIPVFNRKALIFQSVESALRQSYPNREIIVVDDGSIDGTYEALRDSEIPIVLCKHPHNKGQGAARNLGLSTSKGDYVLFLDSDDLLEPNAIQILCGRLRDVEKRDSTWGASYGKMLTCDAELIEVKTNPKRYHSGHILPYLFFDNFVRTGSYLVRKSIMDEIGGFREDLRIQEDRNLLFSIAVRYKFLFVDQVVARYRRHEGARARNQGVNALSQGVAHIDYFFQEEKSVEPAILGVKNKLYAKEHLKLSKVAWKIGMRDQFLSHWKAACSYQKKLFFHPKYVMRAIACRFRGPISSLCV